MELRDLNNYPEYPNNEIVEKFCNLVLDRAGTEVPEETLSNLSYLGDKQWHTYQSPSKELQDRLRNWLIQNWISNSEKYLEGVLVGCYYFALDKEIFRKALDLYNGKYRQQFEMSLKKSIGDKMDPWWSFKTTNKP